MHCNTLRRTFKLTNILINFSPFAGSCCHVCQQPGTIPVYPSRLWLATRLVWFTCMSIVQQTCLNWFTCLNEKISTCKFLRHVYFTDRKLLEIFAIIFSQMPYSQEFCTKNFTHCRSAASFLLNNMAKSFDFYFKRTEGQSSSLPASISQATIDVVKREVGAIPVGNGSWQDTRRIY